ALGDLPRQDALVHEHLAEIGFEALLLVQQCFDVARCEHPGVDGGLTDLDPPPALLLNELFDDWLRQLASLHCELAEARAGIPLRDDGLRHVQRRDPAGLEQISRKGEHPEPSFYSRRRAPPRPAGVNPDRWLS